MSNHGPPVDPQPLANDPEALADRDAIVRMAGGDESALAVLYDRHVTPVYSLVLRIVRRPEDAEDVTQQVFTQAWQSSARSYGHGWLGPGSRSIAVRAAPASHARPTPNC